MRSIYSDPVGAGIDAFAKVVGTASTIQGMRQKKDLMAQQEIDRRIERERQSTLWERQAKAWSEQDEKKYGQDTLNNLSSVYYAQQKADTEGKELDLSGLSDSQMTSILKMGYAKGLFGEDGKVKQEKLEAVKRLRATMQDPALAEAMKQKKQIVLDLSKDEQLRKALMEIYGDTFNQGVDRAGNAAQKRPIAAMIDFSGKVPTVTFELDVIPPKSGAGNVIPLQGYENDVYIIPEDASPQGMIDKGNIDLAKRKVAINGDSISTVLSRSFNIDGKEVLLPLVNDYGKIVSDKEAIAEYNRTGKHLGTFESPESATQYAEKLHNSKIWQPTIEYYRGSYRAPMTFGRDGSPDAPIQQIPAPLLSMQLTSLDTLGNWINRLEAHYGSTELSRKVQASQKTQKENAAINAAFGKVDTRATVSEQRKQFITEFTKLNPDAAAKDTIALSKTIIPDREGKHAEMYRVNPKTGVDEVSKDGGATWGARFSPKQRQMSKERSMTVADMYLAVAGGNPEKALERRKTDEISVAAAKKSNTPKDNEGLKDKRLRVVADSYESNAIIKIAQDKIRKDPKNDPYKAIEDARREVNAAIAKAGKSSIAVKSLESMGLSEEDAMDAVRRYVKQNQKVKK